MFGQFKSKRAHVVTGAVVYGALMVAVLSVMVQSVGPIA